MPKRDPELLLEDILAAIRKVERYTTGMDWEGFRQDAVVRNLEVMGGGRAGGLRISPPAVRAFPAGF
jgi:uncharacterized protein with HEPN domain